MFINCNGLSLQAIYEILRKKINSGRKGLKEGHKPAELTIWEKLFIHKFKN